MRVAVIGGGVSGLATAHRLCELSAAGNCPSEVTLFEASDRLGGVIRTERIGDYLVEMGPDSFITNKPGGVELCRRLGLEDELISTDETFRRSLVLHGGRPVPVPDGFMLLSPAKVWPVLTSPIFSPLGKLRMGLEYLVPRRSNGDDHDESLAAFVRRRFGREALDRLVQPLVGGIYTSDPEKLSLRATMPRFLEMEQRHRSLIRASKRQPRQQKAAAGKSSGARYGLFTTLRDGLSTLVDRLETRIGEHGLIRKNCPVARVIPPTASDMQTSAWQVCPVDGPPLEFDAVILALRAHQCGALIEQDDAGLSAALKSIEYASSAVVVSGHRLEDIRHPLDAFGLVIPAIEQREVLAISFTSRKFAGRAPEGRVLLRTFVGGAMQPEILQRDDEELAATVRRELADILGVQGEPDFLQVSRYTDAMPQYHVGHLSRVSEIETLAAEHSGLALAGNAYAGVGIPDCITSGKDAAERVAGISVSVDQRAAGW